jgi:[ribosomal protein S5]-alanine N-acetyltransferase
MRDASLMLRGLSCSVREWRLADAEALARHANNINIARHLRDRFPHPYTVNHANAFLVHAAREKGPAGNLAIDVDGEAVGAIGFTIGDDLERFSAEIGYWLSEAYWGRGIATEAVVLLTAHVFERLNLLRLFALPFADNAPSARVLEKAGFVREGVLRASAVKYGRSRDQLLYARINDRWRPSVSGNLPG